MLLATIAFYRQPFQATVSGDVACKLPHLRRALFCRNVEMDEKNKSSSKDGREFSICNLEIEEIIRFIKERGPDLKHMTVQGKIKTLLNLSRKIGLSAENITILTEIILSSKLSERNCCCLVFTLIPRSIIPTQCVLNILSRVCNYSLSGPLQIILLKWLAAVYDEIENKDVIHKLYNLIFHFLDSNLCPAVCNLLCKASVKEDLKFFHFEKLKKICVKTGYAKHTLAVLNVYKNLYPHLLTEPVPEVSMDTAFCKSDSIWKTWLINIKKSLQNPKLAISWFEDKNDVEKIADNYFPRVQSAHWFNSLNNLVSLEQTESFEEWLILIDKTKLPSPVASILNHQILHVVYSTYADEDSEFRLNFWLHHMLTEVFISNSNGFSDSWKAKFLLTLTHYYDYSQVKLPACELFLSRFLSTWNGTTCIEPLLEFLPCCLIHSFQELYDFVLKPLSNLYNSASFANKILFIKSLTNLLKNYILHIHHFENYLGNCSQTDNSESQFNRSISPDNSMNDNYDSLIDVIQNLIGFMNVLFINSLKTTEDHMLLIHFFLQFYEMVANMFLKYSLPIIELPPPFLIYKIIFSCNSAYISRLCSLLCRYKEACLSVKQLETVKRSDLLTKHSSDVATLNAFLLNISNALWRCTLFSDSSENSLSSGIAHSVLDELKIHHIDETFNITMHWAFVGFTVRFLQLTQGKEVNLRQLLHKMPKSKDVFLDYLKRQKLTGIYQFRQEFLSKKKA